MQTADLTPNLGGRVIVSDRPLTQEKAYQNMLGNEINGIEETMAQYYRKQDKTYIKRTESNR